MLYWFEVYALVAAAVLLPLLLLYIVVAVSWLGLAAIRSTIRSLKNISTLPASWLRHHWSFTHRVG